jgi:hypothetical protein
MTPPFIARQGDILIRRVAKIPKDLQKVPLDDGRIVLAYGEVTGHAHVVLDPEEKVEFLAADVREMEQRFLRVEAEVDVVHDEHDTITLAPGDYEIVRQREYTPEAPQWVAD